MESPIVKTDFVPKKETTSSNRKASSQGIFFALTVVIFIAVISLWGGLMIYNYFLEKEKVAVEENLKIESAKVLNTQGDLIKNLRKLDTQLKTIDKLLNRHTVFEPLLQFLGENTLKDTVRYNSFDFEIDEGLLSVTVTGEVESFTSLAFQEDVLEENPLIHDFDISEYNLMENGNISFGLNLKISSEVVSYLSYFENDQSYESVDETL